MNSWHTYPTIYNLGHAALSNLLSVPLNIEEKVDGSQFSFGLSEEGDLHLKSKGANLSEEAPEKMFAKAVESVKERRERLRVGWTYRAEYLQKPKHNVLAYDRVPKDHLILFDVNTGEEAYLPYSAKKKEAERLDLEVVPLLAEGSLSQDHLKWLLANTISILGGQKIEGVVIKPSSYDLFGVDKKVLMGKFVSEQFKEVHSGEWRKENPTTGDILDQLIGMVRTPARWAKARQHLLERGLLEGSPRDIGALIKEVPLDIQAELEGEIREKLWAYAWPHIRRASTHGLPEWYKEQLLQEQFEGSEK